MFMMMFTFIHELLNYIYCHVYYHAVNLAQNTLVKNVMYETRLQKIGNVIDF